MDAMALDVKIETSAEMQVLEGGAHSQETHVTQTNGDGNDKDSVNPHKESHVQHSQCASLNTNPCHSHIAAISSPANLSHGDMCVASLTTATALLTSSGVPTDKPDYLLKYGCVMTDEQFETLRRQISVYSTICSQLVEMHKALMSQQALVPNMMLVGQQLPYDPVLAARSSGRQRWTPSQIQLQILENVFEKSNGTPSKQKIKEITVELGQHGSISETNVYNWFQNRKARAKRKQQHKDGESEVEVEEMDMRKDKRAAFEIFHENNGLGRGGNGSFALDGGFGALPSTINPMLENSEGAQSMQWQSQVDAASLFNEGLMQKNDIKEFSTIVVLIDGKPWEVPSTTLNLKGSFGETSALLDSQRQVVSTDERGFTTRPLHAGESYALIKLSNGAA